MTTNLLVKYLSLLIGGMMVLVLASCKDDELAPDFDEPEVNITIPTEDEVKTTVGKTYAVLGEHFDEVTPYVMKRMTGQRYSYSPAATELADNVEIVFLDYDALMEISEEMVYEIKEVFDRGGAVYLHRPNALALMFFDLVMYDELDDFMAWLEEQLKDGGAQTKAGGKVTRWNVILTSYAATTILTCVTSTTVNRLPSKDSLPKKQKTATSKPTPLPKASHRTSPLTTNTDSLLKKWRNG